MARSLASWMVVAAALSLGWACDHRTPTMPSLPTAADVSGTWQGSFVITECPNYLNCGFIGRSAPPTEPWNVELTLTSSDTTISGVLVPHIWGPFPRPVPVSGQIVNGLLSLTGRTSWESTGLCFSGFPAGEFVLRELSARLDSTTRTLSGSIAFQTYKSLNSCYFKSDLIVVSNALTLRPRSLDSLVAD